MRNPGWRPGGASTPQPSALIIGWLLLLMAAVTVGTDILRWAARARAKTGTPPRRRRTVLYGRWRGRAGGARQHRYLRRHRKLRRRQKPRTKMVRITMTMTRAMIEILLMIGGIEMNPGPICPGGCGFVIQRGESCASCDQEQRKATIRMTKQLMNSAGASGSLSDAEQLQSAMAFSAGCMVIIVISGEGFIGTYDNNWQLDLHTSITQRKVSAITVKQQFPSPRIQTIAIIDKASKTILTKTSSIQPTAPAPTTTITRHQQNGEAHAQGATTTTTNSAETNQQQATDVLQQQQQQQTTATPTLNDHRQQEQQSQQQGTTTTTTTTARQRPRNQTTTTTTTDQISPRHTTTTGPRSLQPIPEGQRTYSDLWVPLIAAAFEVRLSGHFQVIKQRMESEHGDDFWYAVMTAREALEYEGWQPHFSHNYLSAPQQDQAAAILTPIEEIQRFIMAWNNFDEQRRRASC